VPYDERGEKAKKGARGVPIRNLLKRARMGTAGTFATESRSSRRVKHSWILMLYIEGYIVMMCCCRYGSAGPCFG
jgi:hypothetical protein